MDYQAPRIVWIEWLDSNTTHGWRTKETTPQDMDHLRCESIGFLVDETDDLVSIASSWDE